MPVNVYKATDAGAPSLSGTVGSFIALLDACLVTGYGSKAAAGWTKPFIGTNTAVFRPNGGNRRYLQVDDTAAVTSILRGYEAMTDAVTGTGPFPTAAQSATGLYALKSSTANATARNWVLIATDAFFILHVDYSSVVGAFASVGNPLIAFGDPVSYKPGGDSYHSLLMAGTTTVNTAHNGATVTTNISFTVAGHYMPRSHTGVGGAIAVGKHMDAAKSGTATVSCNGGAAYPDPVTGGILISPMWLNEASLVRGHIPGLWGLMHPASASFAVGDTFDGTGDLAGRSFLIVGSAGGSTVGKVALEVSNTWS